MLDYIKTHDSQYLQVDRIGSGAKIVVLIHGIGGSSHLWIPFALASSKEYTYIIPNLRGFGKSKSVKFCHETNVLFDFALDINAVIDHYRTDTVTVCALSMGAYSMMYYFQLYGTLAVDRYLSIDQSPKAINDADWRWGLAGEQQEGLLSRFNTSLEKFECELRKPYAALDSRLRIEYLDSISEFFNLAFHRPLEKLVAGNLLKIPLIREVTARAVYADTWESYYYCLVSYQRWDYDFRVTMQAIDIPVTLLIGKYSDMYPAEGQREMARVNPNIQTVEFEESHGLMYTSPVKFQRELNRFLMG